MTEEKINSVILYSVEKLTERDNPSLETMKMQVEYDSAFLNDDNEAQKTIRNRNKMIASHKSSILAVEMADANDFESLTALYRKIFRFLLEFCPNSKLHDRVMEREVAAALESVFPRVGLKAFAQLTTDEKTAQLMELARIVLGIRLFNKDQGRGGAGLDNMDMDAVQLAVALSLDIDREMEFFSDACNKYQKALIRAHLQKRRQQMATERMEEENYQQSQMKYGDDHRISYSSSTPSTTNNAGSLSHPTAMSKQATTTDNSHPSHIQVDDRLIERWSAELANRQQYLGFLRTLQQEIHSLHEKMAQYTDSLRSELDQLKSLITNKTSVPKEIVYPRFDSLGSLWIQTYEDLLFLLARKSTYRSLCHFRLSFQPTLLESFYSDSEEQTALQWKTFVEIQDSQLSKEVYYDKAGLSNPSNNNPLHSQQAVRGGGNRFSIHEGQEKSPGGNVSPDPFVQNIASSSSDMPGKDHGTHNASSLNSPSIGDSLDTTHQQISQGNSSALGTVSAATLLSVHNTPDFLMLPLELQGFCPWTFVHARGLLIPGKPALGVIRYQNAYFVCDHETAISAFLEQPNFYLSAIQQRARDHPELLQLLHLQRWFPQAALQRLLEASTLSYSGPGDMGPTGKVLTRDVGTGTPVHFVEQNWDVNYHWNEWELRRRALKVVQLQHCTTHGVQTDASHYRRENDSQVYVPREQGTQTRTERGTNPPLVTTYVAGLRGKVPPSSSSAAVSLGSEAKEAKEAMDISSNRAGSKTSNIMADTKTMVSRYIRPNNEGGEGEEADAKMAMAHHHQSRTRDSKGQAKDQRDDKERVPDYRPRVVTLKLDL